MKRLLLILFILLLSCSQTFAGLATHGTIVIQGRNNELDTELLLTDPFGKRTGFDPIANQTFKEDYPNSSYFIENQTGLENENHHVFVCNDAKDGIYTIKVTGKTLRKYSIFVSYPRPIPLHSITIMGFTDANKVDNYTFDYNFMAGKNGTILTPVKVAMPSDLIADITAAGKLGYIGNQEFINELVKKVQKIEKERTEVQKPEEQKDKERKDNEHITPAQKAIKVYKELLEELTEKYQRCEKDEFVKKEAYTVLKEDLDYIIGHIQ